METLKTKDHMANLLPDYIQNACDWATVRSAAHQRRQMNRSPGAGRSILLRQATGWLCAPWRAKNRSVLRFHVPGARIRRPSTRPRLRPSLCVGAVENSAAHRLTTAMRPD
jgi:hypothetical protein